jgi:hypothetical protein
VLNFKCVRNILNSLAIVRAICQRSWNIVSRMTTMHLMHINRGFGNSYELNAWLSLLKLWYTTFDVLLSQLSSFSNVSETFRKAWQLWEQYIKGGWCSIVSRMTTKHLMHINRGFTNSYALNVWCWTHVRLDVFCCWTHVRFGELLFPSTLWLLETSFIYRIEKICFFFGFIYLAMKKR